MSKADDALVKKALKSFPYLGGDVPYQNTACSDEVIDKYGGVRAIYDAASEGDLVQADMVTELATGLCRTDCVEPPVYDPEDLEWGTLKSRLVTEYFDYDVIMDGVKVWLAKVKPMDKYVAKSRAYLDTYEESEVLPVVVFSIDNPSVALYHDVVESDSWGTLETDSGLVFDAGITSEGYVVRPPKSEAEKDRCLRGYRSSCIGNIMNQYTLDVDPSTVGKVFKLLNKAGYVQDYDKNLV